MCLSFLLSSYLDTFIYFITIASSSDINYPKNQFMVLCFYLLFFSFLFLALIYGQCLFSKFNLLPIYVLKNQCYLLAFKRGIHFIDIY